MTPAAQVFSASEILQEILNGKRVDLLLKQWGKSNRYAGSKDRHAIRDFVYPDRVVVGSNDKKTSKILKKLYSPLIAKGAKYVHTSRRAAELIKYASNAFLATKITFINEIANLCEKTNINIDDISIGDKVRVVFEKQDDEFTIPKFIIDK